MQIVRIAAALAIGCSSVLFVGCGDDDSDAGSTDQGGSSGSKAATGAGGSKSAAGGGGAGGKSAAGSGGAGGKSAADGGGTGGKSPASRGGSDADGSDAGVESGSAQTPPQGADAVEAWLSKGSYKAWHCEDKVHASRSPSPHGFNRICSNDLIAANATGAGDWPRGSAAVKELYASADSTKPFGYSVYLKKETDSAAGVNWYWYERLPLDTKTPENTQVVADGPGDMGGSKDICVACHVAAGGDPAHTPTVGGRDEVYTPVP